MRLTHQQLGAALDVIAETISKADSTFEQSLYNNDPWDSDSAEWYLKTVYAQLRVLCEALELPQLREEIVAALMAVKQGNLLEHEVTPDGEPYLKHL